jgi:AAA domain-containing protein
MTNNESAENSTLRQRLRHVCWVGGGSGAGKSTVARRLADGYGLQLYSTDDVMAEHHRRSSPVDSPLLTSFAEMDADERWVNRSPTFMLETFPWYGGECFGMIVEDLLDLHPNEPVVAEGFRLLPRLVQPLLTVPTRAVWLLPTPDLRRIAFDSRRPSGPPWSFVDQCTDPDRALGNLLQRDRLFTDGLAEEAQLLGLHTITVDASMGEHKVAQQVVDWFGL